MSPSALGGAFPRPAGEHGCSVLLAPLPPVSSTEQAQKSPESPECSSLATPGTNPKSSPLFFFYLFFFPSLRCPVILCSIHLHPRDGVWLLGARCTASPPVQVITAGCLPPSCPGCFCAPHAWELVSEWEEGEIKVS